MEKHRKTLKIIGKLSVHIEKQVGGHTPGATQTAQVTTQKDQVKTQNVQATIQNAHVTIRKAQVTTQ